jgi:5,10-methylenetetrahydromethanopterin reductase
VSTGRLGVMFPRAMEPESLVGFAQQAERAGLDELWIVEDCFWAGGLTTAAVALASTQTISVCLGIVPAVLRNPALLAMETANLARLYPGRTQVGIGHGVAGWMAQVGATPKSWMTTLEETASAVRSLLRGERVTVAGQAVSLQNVDLVHAPNVVPPVTLGVRKPKGVALAASVADGLILAELTTPADVAEARRVIGPDALLTVYVFASIDPVVGNRHVSHMFREWAAAGGFEAGTTEPVAGEVLLSGPVDTWAAQAQQWWDAGATSVVITPLPDAGQQVIDALAAHGPLR